MGVVKCIHTLYVRFGNDLEVITGQFPKRVWLYMWKYVSPLVITLILIGSIIKQGINPITYDVYRNVSRIDACVSVCLCMCVC